MAKAIMIQGTMSNAGKSFLAAGLCRIFQQDGWRTAPFKSQNMALNSYVTRDGLEMGRAQVVQAEAAGVEPSVNMNPILLKPSSDTGSQVIVRGVSAGIMPAKEYFVYKKHLIPKILEAYEALDAEYEVIVIEGAGSPAEINLKENDIVNMGLARMVGAPVLLAGDIDCGGVFAQLYGTVMLLPEEERNRIQGLVINKFRGERSILDPGVKMLEDLCHIPVVGVVPYAQVDLEDEDSLSGSLSGQACLGAVDIAVIRLPHISNFTDFHVFGCVSEAAVRYVGRADELGEPDLVILPGTKNTIGDLFWMRENGLEAAVVALAAREVPVLGICGGYQMLGRTLSDPNGVDGGRSGAETEGMGLLPVSTVFGAEKRRVRVTGRFGRVTGPLAVLSGLQLEGYEIHMGKTEAAEDLAPFSRIEESCPPMSRADSEQGLEPRRQPAPDGCISGSVYGTYVHGLFDRDEAARAVVHALLRRKGLSAEGNVRSDYRAYRQEQYDRLASVLRRSLDMERIYRMMDLKR